MAETYTVDYQRPTVDFRADGQVIDVWEVGFTDRQTGTSGTVRVARNLYTADTVAEAIETQLDAIRAVAGL